MNHDDTLASDLSADHDVHEPSASAHLLDELIRYAHRPMGDEADPRPLPEPDMAEMALGSMFESLSSLLTGTRLEDDLPDLLWSLVNILHRKGDRISRSLDDNAVAQRRSQGEQRGLGTALTVKPRGGGVSCRRELCPPLVGFPGLHGG